MIQGLLVRKNQNFDTPEMAGGCHIARIHVTVSQLECARIPCLNPEMRVARGHPQTDGWEDQAWITITKRY